MTTVSTLQDRRAVVALALLVGCGGATASGGTTRQTHCEGQVTLHRVWPDELHAVVTGELHMLESGRPTDGESPPLEMTVSTAAGMHRIHFVARGTGLHSPQGLLPNAGQAYADVVLDGSGRVRGIEGGAAVRAEFNAEAQHRNLSVDQARVALFALSDEQLLNEARAYWERVRRSRHVSCSCSSRSAQPSIPRRSRLSSIELSRALIEPHPFARLRAEAITWAANRAGRPLPG